MPGKTDANSIPADRLSMLRRSISWKRVVEVSGTIPTWELPPFAEWDKAMRLEFEEITHEIYRIWSYQIHVLLQNIYDNISHIIHSPLLSCLSGKSRTTETDDDFPRRNPDQ